MSLISEAMTIGVTANLYGSIPYSQAAKKGIYTPKFDKQIAVFKDVIDTLNTAISILESGVPNLPSGVDAFTLMVMLING